MSIIPIFAIIIAIIGGMASTLALAFTPRPISWILSLISIPAFIATIALSQILTPLIGYFGLIFLQAALAAMIWSLYIKISDFLLGPILNPLTEAFMKLFQPLTDWFSEIPYQETEENDQTRYYLSAFLQIFILIAYIITLIAFFTTSILTIMLLIGNAFAAGFMQMSLSAAIAFTLKSLWILKWLSIESAIIAALALMKSLALLAIGSPIRNTPTKTIQPASA